MPDDQDWRARLRQLLLERALIWGTVTLSSGATSDYYFDGKMVTLSAEGAYRAAQGILALIADDSVDAVGGPPRGADPLAGAVAALSFLQGRPLATFMVRKEPKRHGTQKMIEGPLPPGARVVIVEDVVTTGGSVLEAIAQVEVAGATIVRVIALVDRQTGAQATLASRGYRYTPIFTIDELGIPTSAGTQ